MVVELLRRLIRRIRPMTQMLVKCPKTGSNVTWDECLPCKDKTPECPPLSIRKSSRPREYLPGVYHVTELIHPRRSYFNRVIAFAKGLDPNNYMDFIIGIAIHRFIQRGFKPNEVEIKVSREFPDGFIISGSIDVISDGVLYDFKSTASLYFRIKENAPDPDHVFQTQAYYSLLKHQNPELASQIKRIRIVYLGKKPERMKMDALVRRARSLIKNPTSANHIREIVSEIDKIKSARLTRYKEFDFEPKDITKELVKRGAVMHESFKSFTPPADLCPAWLCGYCDYVRPCAGDFGNYVKDFATFTRLLEQGKRGLEKVAEYLESKGHRVLVDPIAATCQIFLNPRDKPRGRPDIVDVTAGEIIDVKTTSNTDAFWINEKHLEPAVKRGWIFYIILGDGKMIKIAARSLMDKIKSAKVEKRYFKYGSERGFLFKKDVAEVVG